MKYRKKPVVVEATQWFKKGDHPMVFANDDGTHEIWTLEGNHQVTPGDWIITGVKGEYYPCKPDIFAMTYELAAATHKQDLLANARLICAAPELMEALKAMLTHMGMDEDEWNKPTFDQARAAVAKAEGENHERS